MWKADSFRAFLATHENHGQVQEEERRFRVEARKEYEQLVSEMAGFGGAIVAGELGVPQQSGPIGTVLETTLHAGAAGIAKFEDFMTEKLRGISPPRNTACTPTRMTNMRRHS